jgi:hypothetical protein
MVILLASLAERVNVTVVLVVYSAPALIKIFPVGGVLSIFVTVALVHVCVFPTLSLICTSHVTVLLVRVQFPPAVDIPLSSSVLLASVAVTFPFVGVVGV